MKSKLDRLSYGRRDTAEVSETATMNRKIVAEHVARGRQLKSLYMLALLKKMFRPFKPGSAGAAASKRTGGRERRAAIRGESSGCKHRPC